MGFYSLPLTLVFCLTHCLAFQAQIRPTPRTQGLQFSIVDDVIRSSERVSPENEDAEKSHPPHLVFPGGGLFFYWQAGTITYLREQGYNIDQITASGASAGALTATLMATNVDFNEATDLALQLSDEAGVWDRKDGLQGIWGSLIEEWLDRLLPDNAHELANNRLSLLVTKIPSFKKAKVSTFHNREDLIRCNMASVHLPWFLDGKLTAMFRNQPHIDGSFLAKAPDYVPEHKPSTILRLDWSKDPAYKGGDYFDFIKVISKEGIWDILNQGKKHAKTMEEQGRFRRLPKL